MHHQTSRRSFLSSIAILSAGTAFGSANDFFSVGKTDLQQQWKSFYKQNRGSPFYQLQPGTETLISSCKGHIHKRGTLIYFSNEDILARPTWIYWGREKSKPDDVLISFFENSGQKEKIFTINRFELESMCALTAHENVANPLLTLKDTAPIYRDLQKEKSMKIMTRVREGRDVRIVVRYLKKEITIENKLIYNI